MKDDTDLNSKSGYVGIIAGSGRLPCIVADAVREAGGKTFLVAHRNETDPKIEKHATHVEWVKLGQLGKIRSLMLDAHIDKACFAGALRKVRFFRDARPDVLGLKVLSKIAADKGDDRILRAIADVFEKAGLKIVAPTRLAPGLLAPEGIMGRHKPGPEQKTDMELGISVARALGLLDIGQTIVVREGVVLAVEAVDGTDEAIRRGCELGSGPVVVVKKSKPQQDLRFDLPAVGPATVETMAAYGKGGMIAVEAGKTVVLDREKMVEIADDAGIAIVGYLS